MYQPAHLDSFLRLLISHLGSVLTEGERLMERQSNDTRMDRLQYAIEHGDDRSQQVTQQQDSEALFVLQMSQSREWVDRLGQLDPDVERETDEFLAATFSIEKLLHNRRTREIDYQLENRIASTASAQVLKTDLISEVDVEAMICAIFELLGRLEEQYDLMEELLEMKQVVNGIPFGRKYTANKSAKIIPLFAHMKKSIHQDNERGSQ